MRQGHRSTGIDWTSATVYGVFTAVALGILIVFVGFLDDRLGAISWTILIAGFVGGGAIVLTLILRWYSSQILRDVAAQAADPISRLSESFGGDSDSPITRDELRSVRADLLALWPHVLRVARIGLSVMFLMAIMVEVIALATGAVAYLQAERLRQQNLLLTSQLSIQETAFLSSSLSSIAIIRNNLVHTQTLVRNLEDTISVSASTVDAFVSESLDQIRMEDLIVDVCPVGEDTSCNHLALDVVQDWVRSDGQLLITEENAAALRGYFRLSEAAAQVLALFAVTVGTPDTTYEEDIEKGAQLLSDATATCGGGGEFALPELWKTILGVGHMAMGLWSLESLSEVRPGRVISYPENSDKARFMAFATGIKLLTANISEHEGAVGGPHQAAVAFGKGLQALLSGTQELIENCSNESLSLGKQIQLIRQRRSDIVEHYLPAQRTPPRTPLGQPLPQE